MIDVSEARINAKLRYGQGRRRVITMTPDEAINLDSSRDLSINET